MNVLFVAGDCPYPPDNGGRLRTFNLLKRLSLRHRITLIAPAVPDADLDYAFDNALTRTILVPPVRRTLTRMASSLASPLPFGVSVRKSSAMNAAVRQALDSDHFDLLHCDWISYVSAIPIDAPIRKVYGSHNVEAVIWERYLSEEGRDWMIPILRSQAMKVAAYESRLPQIFDWCVTVSELDRDRMRQRYGWENVSVAPNGVDLSFYKPIPDSLGSTVTFVASLDYRANRDSVRWFIKSIWPRIKSRIPEVRMSLIGRKPPRWVARICASAGISLHSDVPDVRPYLADAVLVVVPLRIGGGSRLKVLEAMAAGRCVVSTTIGAEGLDVCDGKHLLIADEPEDFASRVVTLLQNPTHRRALASSARSLVDTKYGWDFAAQQIEVAWTETCKHPALRSHT